MVASDAWTADPPYLRRVGPNFRLAILVGVDGEAPIDATIELNDGIERFATFFTPNSIQRIRDSNAAHGECLGGRYFWADHMIIVESIEPSFIEEVVADLVRSGEVYSAFGVAS